MSKFLLLQKYRLIITCRHVLIWLERQRDKAERVWIKRKLARGENLDATFSLDSSLMAKMSPDERALYAKDVSRWRERAHDLDLALENTSKIKL